MTDAVLRQEFEPGAPIREAYLAERYGVGRNTVRASLRSLVHAGLLRHAHNRGVFVPEYTVEDVRDLFLLRSALEGEAVRAVASSNRPLDGVLTSLARLEALEPGSDWTTTVQVDLELHAAIVASAGGERMSRAYRGLVLELRLLLAHVQHLYPRPASLVPGHQEIVAALLERDHLRASAVLRAHLDESAAQIIDAVGQARRDVAVT